METLRNEFIIAQSGGNVDSGGLEDFMRQFGDAIKTWSSVLVGIAGLVIVTVLVIKAIFAYRGNRQSDVVKHIIGIVVVVILTVLGIGGIFAIVDAIKPVDGNGVTEYLQ